MAIWQRQPKTGLIVHLDQGAQYTSQDYRHLMKTHGFIGSMSKKGCQGNAEAESFFGSLKQDRVHWRNYSTRLSA